MSLTVGMEESSGGRGPAGVQIAVTYCLRAVNVDGQIAVYMGPSLAPPAARRHFPRQWPIKSGWVSALTTTGRSRKAARYTTSLICSPNAGKIPTSIKNWREANGGTHVVMADVYVKKDGTKADAEAALQAAIDEVWGV
ncbi:hypothetical protein IW261DRAFT_1574576 [Armillaria novae-zelandiae]|uniref:Uncharacterized protein n=1 Tax=Armillaria novae-zelandiae TaxID=153914 RepID=A0AA39NJ57_9AGAR|nr:hypothetical protein IW261DRAFT_1574576 [Armillaria novae-zelandiae]